MIDFKNATFMKLKPVDNSTFASLIQPMFISGEEFIQSFQTIRDGVVFTNKRIFAINIQGLLDGVLPKLIPLAITLGIYTLIKKGWTPVKCILLILICGVVGCAFGIFAGDSKAMDADGNKIPGGYTPLVEWYELPAEEQKTGRNTLNSTFIIQGHISEKRYDLFP